jgi:hypothetical protein
MNKTNNIIHKSFQYDFGKKKSTIVEFDIVVEGGKKIAKNITLTSNWRAHYPNNPQISSTPQGEYGFSGDGVIITNGDIQQMIKRIFQIVNEVKH